MLWLWAIVHSGKADRSKVMCCGSGPLYIAVKQIVVLYVLWLWAIVHSGKADRSMVMCCGCGPFYIAVHSGRAERSSAVLLLLAIVHSAT